MKGIQFLFLLLPFFLCVYSVTAGEASSDPVEQLKWLESANPENDAKKAIEEKDLKK